MFMFSGALSAIMIMAANDIIAGNMSVGSLVSVPSPNESCTIILIIYI